MKNAFDSNVSRARPRMRLTAPSSEPEISIEAIAAAVAAEPPTTSLAGAVKERAAALEKPKPSAVEAVQAALAAESPPHESSTLRGRAHGPRVQETVAAPPAVVAAAVPRAHAEPPPAVVEVQTQPAPVQPEGDQPETRRERLKERLKAVRENPKPEPLPETVAEAGVLAVERISALQTELAKVRAVNLALSQDLEGARRQAERATEEARLRVDEAKRLSQEMETRGRLLSELERELASLEGERDESLLALQEARASIDQKEREKDELKREIDKRDVALADSLSEEERLAAELEEAAETTASLRKTCDTLRSERETLARQVSDLTKERAELLEARKALQAVHRALSTAAAR
jgi:hypothetical protein